MKIIPTIDVKLQNKILTECPIKIGTTLEKGNNTNQKNVDYFISLFHELVSNGPVYVCSCCDQLWYKHSVSLADKIRKEYPSSAEKYLSNRKSVKNMEWLCRTYHNYVVKNKVPPSAVLNGMQFATKPDFFDLNELEIPNWKLELELELEIPKIPK